MLINDALKDLERRKEKFLSWRDAEKTALEIKEKFSKNGLEISLDIDWISAIDGIYIKVYQVKDMADLKPIFRFLAQNGYTRRMKPILLGDYKMVIWHYNDIALIAYFNSPEENACKFIQTGTKEIPVYEIDCPGLSDQLEEETNVSRNPTQNSADGIQGI